MYLYIKIYIYTYINIDRHETRWFITKPLHTNAFKRIFRIKHSRFYKLTFCVFKKVLFNKLNKRVKKMKFQMQKSITIVLIYE